MTLSGMWLVLLFVGLQLFVGIVFLAAIVVMLKEIFRPFVDSGKELIDNDQTKE